MVLSNIERSSALQISGYLIYNDRLIFPSPFFLFLLSFFFLPATNTLRLVGELQAERLLHYSRCVSMYVIQTQLNYESARLLVVPLA